MKNIRDSRIACLVLITTSGCSFAPYISPEERCAVRGMVLGGITEETSTSGSIAYSNRTGLVSGSTTTYSEGIICREIQPKDNPCFVRALQASARIKYEIDFNGRFLGLVIGYSLVLVPGIIMNIIFHSSANSAEDEARRRFQEVLNECHQALRQQEVQQEEVEDPDNPDVPPIPEGMEAPPFRLPKRS